MRDAIFREVPAEWQAAYDAGVFTEFMEQRAPGHTVLGDVIYRTGFLDLDRGHRPRARRARRGARSARVRQALELRAMRHRGRGDHPLRRPPRRARARRWRRPKPTPTGARELLQIAADLRPRAGARAAHFWEALQAYWFVHLGVITELNTWDSFCPGRLDQHLLAVLRARPGRGPADARPGAKELLECFWVKFNNQPAPPKVGVTAAESGTYTDFCNINVGGLTRRRATTASTT